MRNGKPLFPQNTGQPAGKITRAEVNAAVVILFGFLKVERVLRLKPSVRAT